MSQGYVLSQQTGESAERARLALVDRFHDPITIDCLQRAGVSEGWRCLDVGAGTGSVARWLAERVGRDGEVHTVDLDTALLDPLRAPAVRVAGGDILYGPPLEADFDLVHTRLLLIHLAGAEQAVAHLVAAARPGGLVVVGDIDFTSFTALDPVSGWRGTWDSFLLATQYAGWDAGCGRRLATLLAGGGLADVRAEAVGGSFVGGELPCELIARTLERLRDRLLAMYLAPDDLDQSIAHLRDPHARFVGPDVWTAWGQRPLVSS